MSQHEKILKIMLSHPDKTYWLPSDFMKPELIGDLFIGYEASARLSELRSNHPEVFRGLRDGKYIATSLNWEFIRNGNYKMFLPAELRQIINPSLF